MKAFIKNLRNLILINIGTILKLFNTIILITTMIFLLKSMHTMTGGIVYAYIVMWVYFLINTIYLEG